MLLAYLVVFLLLGTSIVNAGDHKTNSGFTQIASKWKIYYGCWKEI